jgi:hypothetical protein
VPIGLVEETIGVLRHAGLKGIEAFVLWGGVVEGETLSVRSMFVPEQVGHVTDHGLLVTVDGTALFEVNKALYERGLILVAQVHSHPTDAFHSDTDDCYPLVTLEGALSVVVPDFGRDGLDAVDDWAWYRLTGEQTWTPLGAGDRVRIVREAP